MMVEPRPMMEKKGLVTWFVVVVVVERKEGQRMAEKMEKKIP